MSTLIRYVGPEGSLLPDPYYSGLDYLAQYHVKQGGVYKFKPRFESCGVWGRVEAIQKLQMTVTGVPARVILVRPLSTLN